jgi:UDP-glucose 4-epimerase
MKKILVTGASGYLGSHISLYLAKNNYKVTALCYPKPSEQNKWQKTIDNIIVGDIRDKKVIDKLTKQDYDIIIHLISLDHKSSENSPSVISQINVMPAWQLLDIFTKKRIEKFIYFSTQQVFGKIPQKNIDENFLPKPLNNYGLTHLLCEKIVNFYNNTADTKCINIRLSNGYGSPVFKDNNCWWLVVNDLCKTAFFDKKIKLLSDGSPQRDFIYVKDIAKAVKTLIETKNSDLQNNIFHISSGNTLTILELAYIVKDVYQTRYNKKISVYLPDGSISDNANKFKNIKRYTIDNSKIKNLGFKAETNLFEGINELFEYLEKNENTGIQL